MDFDDVIDFFLDIFTFDWVGDLWDSFLDFLTFDWIGDAWDFFIGIFTLGEEFSLPGLFFGILAGFLDFVLRDYLIKPFVITYSPVGQLTMTIITIAVTAIGGYFVGARIFDD